MTNAYRRPPIIEAVVEVRVVTPLDDALLNKLQNLLAERYPAPPQKTANISVEAGPNGVTINQEASGFKILSNDGTFTVSVGRGAISTSRTAPYGGWDEFIGEAVLNWEVWKKVAGRRDIARIGLRYINRIDVPVAENVEISMDDILNFGVKRPRLTGFGPMTQFAVNAEIPMLERPYKLILNSSPTPSPLVKTASFLLDLDLSLDHQLPKNDDALWGEVTKFREIKNLVFDACITDKTRELLS